MANPKREYHPDDIAIWPDGWWMTLDELWRGGDAGRSDDYEIVRIEDQDRLRALGIAEELDIE
ncbi:MAG: hypothetical protein CVT77_17130 [Alphaproteobacteria bacterium HGW-Alphaproteobacteria-16]|nr:MAG: hypothetical protein CVT77_17130 [Alphaproteobacteria bacterium HGW-Alphaproteobacteria-16]